MKTNPYLLAGLRTVTCLVTLGRDEYEPVVADLDRLAEYEALGTPTDIKTKLDRLAEIEKGDRLSIDGEDFVRVEYDSPEWKSSPLNHIAIIGWHGSVATRYYVRESWLVEYRAELIARPKEA